MQGKSGKEDLAIFRQDRMFEFVQLSDELNSATTCFGFRSGKGLPMTLITSEAPEGVEMIPNEFDAGKNSFGFRVGTRGFPIGLLTGTPMSNEETAKEVVPANCGLGVDKFLIVRRDRRGKGDVHDDAINRIEKKTAENRIAFAFLETAVKCFDKADSDGNTASVMTFEKVVVGLDGTTGRTERTRIRINAMDVTAAGKNAMNQLDGKMKLTRRAAQVAKCIPVNRCCGRPVARG